MLRRGASFSSAICSGFCKLDALFVSAPTRSVQPDASSKERRHLFQTTARRDPPRPLTTNHTAFDDGVNPPLEEFLPSPSEPPLPLAAGDGDNQKVEGGEEGGPDLTWRLKQTDRRRTEAHEQGHAPPFQSAAGVSHGTRASGGEAPP